MFVKVPIELHQQIASYLDNDLDLAHYRALCRVTYQAIDADGCSFWRRRFLLLFETPSWKSTIAYRFSDNEKLRDEYKKRTAVIGKGVVFKTGARESEKAYLELIKDLVLDALRDGGLFTTSKNIHLLMQIIEDTNLLRIVGLDSFGIRKKDNKGKPILPANPMLYAIQCVLAPVLLSLNPSFIALHYGFPDAQQFAYSSDIEAPIFGGFSGLEINMSWLLANIQFWRHHLLRDNEGILQHDFANLSDSDRLRWWETQLSQNIDKLGCHWKGSYAFVNRGTIKEIRAGEGQEIPIMDEVNGEQDNDAFQDLRLQLVDPKTAVPWPTAFETHLKSLKAPVNKARTRAQKHHSSAFPANELVSSSLRFDGSGYDNYEDFCASGWLNPLPPQHGIPGWQRMTMMKFFIDEVTFAIDHEALWAYEGVVLPGGQIMVGRWWCPTDGYGDDMYSGPFIQWCVDTQAEKVKADKDMEALKKGESIEMGA